MHHVISDLAHAALRRMPPDPVNAWTPRVLQAWPSVLPHIKPHHCEPRNVNGLQFRNPIGLAAGADKNARALSAWDRLGFGFVEVGTVTRHAQEGNPPPRLFRIPNEVALINRLGFNSDGISAVCTRVSKWRRRNPTSTMLVGINIGPNRHSTDIPDDLAFSFKHASIFADYITINLSSPNTLGLRDWQAKDGLERIIDKLMSTNSTGLCQTPTYIKIAPDLTIEDELSVLQIIEASPLCGIISCNTTIERPGNYNENIKEKKGGLSGLPLTSIAQKQLVRLRSASRQSTTLISVGGVTRPHDVIERLFLGANLVQLYTGFAYAGPALIQESLEHLSSNAHELLTRRAQDSSVHNNLHSIPEQV